jgi:hypothetical protein
VVLIYLENLELSGAAGLEAIDEVPALDDDKVGGPLDDDSAGAPDDNLNFSLLVQKYINARKQDYNLGGGLAIERVGPTSISNAAERLTP